MARKVGAMGEGVDHEERLPARLPSTLFCPAGSPADCLSAQLLMLPPMPPPPPPPAGFSLAGGALWASLCFVAAFALYIATVLPVEERMLREAFGDKHERYV